MGPDAGVVAGRPLAGVLVFVSDALSGLAEPFAFVSAVVPARMPAASRISAKTRIPDGAAETVCAQVIKNPRQQALRGTLKIMAIFTQISPREARAELTSGTKCFGCSADVAVLYMSLFWGGVGFGIGAIVGSFLNVCIHRLPLGLSVYSPPRSFCPQCGEGIRLRDNIPLISWMMLRGRCRVCSKSIPVRYFWVEALAALLFASVFYRTGLTPSDSLALTAAHCTLFSLLLVGAFVDWEHYIIPDQISLGGLFIGLLFGIISPSIHGVSCWWQGGLCALAGATAGAGLLWCVREGGRWLFGKVNVAFESPQKVVWEKREHQTVFRVGAEELLWEEIFFRGTEVILLEAEGGVCSSGNLSKGRWVWNERSLHVGDQTISLDAEERVEAWAVGVSLPREVMGLGDVKLMAAIGAFLGWKATLFVLTAGASLGALAGGGAALAGYREVAAHIPFGPYLAMGAVWWVFAGEQTLRLYWGLLGLVRG